MAAVEIFFSENEVFLSDFSVNKSTKNQNFYIILGSAVTICVPNMYIKFRKDWSSKSEKRSKQHEKSSFEQNAFKVFVSEK